MITRLARWLFVEPRHVWLCLAGCVVAIGAAMAFGGTEKAIRISGLILQLAGILTVVWGIIESRQFFEMPSPVEVFRDWLFRFPLRRLPPIKGSLAIALGETKVGGRGHTSWGDDPTLPLEERIIRLAENFPLIHERITNLQTQLDSAVDQLSAAIKNETNERAEQVNALDHRILRHGTGGLHISAIGAVWLFVGSILGTACQELASWVQ